MKNFKLQIYTVIVLSGIIMVFMVDGIQDEESVANTPSTADQIFASTSSQIKDPFNSIPPNWSRVEPKSSMRLAEYLVETTKGSYSVIVFKNIGGNQDQNIERWFNQFSGERIPELKQHSESMDIRESQLTFVQTSGTFNGGMGQSEPMDRAGLLGFIINSDNDVYYFKAVAAADIIIDGKRDFVQTILSLPLF